MSIVDRVKAQLLTEMTNIEELFENISRKVIGNEVKTTEVVIRYLLNGKDHFMTLDNSDIHDLLEARANRLRKELVK